MEVKLKMMMATWQVIVQVTAEFPLSAEEFCQEWKKYGVLAMALGRSNK